MVAFMLYTNRKLILFHFLSNVKLGHYITTIKLFEYKWSNIAVTLLDENQNLKRVNHTTTIFYHACRSLMRLQASTAGSRSHQFSFCCLLLLFVKAFPNSNQLSELSEYTNLWKNEFLAFMQQPLNGSNDSNFSACYGTECLHMINLMLIYHVQGVPTEMNVRSCQVDKYDCNLVAEKMSYVWMWILFLQRIV